MGYPPLPDLDDWEDFPMSVPGRLISDGHQFHEVPLLSTPSASFASSPHSPVDIEMDSVPTLTLETDGIALLHTPATSMTSGGAGAASPLGSLLFPSTGMANMGIALSDKAARALIEAYIRTSLWYQVHTIEPRIDEPCVPACGLQLAKPDHSIWACFFKTVRRKGTPVFKCLACGHESDRLHRAVSHQRAKWGHKPFPCKDPGCTFRGSTKESLSDHRSARTATAPCSLCNQEIVIKNMGRHLKNMH